MITHGDPVYKKTEYNTRLILRNKLLVLLGLVCTECGYDDDVRALHISHKFGDGSQDRRNRGTDYNFYKSYLANPEDAKERLETRCANCNYIRKIVNGEHCNQHTKKIKYPNWK